jgi:serine/arginine repetitive matrix protein 2
MQTLERTNRSQRSHRSLSNRSDYHSSSNGSTNRRNDSDGPSSDATSPPTPTYMVASGGVGRPIGKQAHIPDNPTIRREPLTNYQEYSDYTERWENNDPNDSISPLGSILEEQGSPKPLIKKVDVATVDAAFHTNTTMRPEIAELPESSSPKAPVSLVPRPLTRELVKSMIGPMSPTGGLPSYAGSANADSFQDASTNDGRKSVDIAQHDQSTASRQTVGHTVNRRSILSQADSSVVNSSTIELAITKLVTATTEHNVEAATAGNTTEASGADRAPTTEDGMSDLLDDYQHTDDVKHEADSALHEDILADDCTERRSSHAAKSSDEQSFKSCTDLPDSTEYGVEKVEANSLIAGGSIAEPAPAFKGSDAKSFKTCKDAVTSEHVASASASSLPLSRLAVSDAKSKRPASAMPFLSPLASEHKPPLPSTSDSSLMKPANPFRSNHKSASASIASSTGSPHRGPPPVPPRESSSSKEAQRSHAALAWLAKGKARLSGKTAKKDVAQPEEDNSQNIPTPPPMRERLLSRKVTGDLDQGLNIDNVSMATAPAEPSEMGSMSKNELTRDSMSPSGPSLRTTPAMQARPSTSSSPLKHVSAMSLPDVPSSFPGRARSSLVGRPQTPEGNRRDSQTTTRLSWHAPGPQISRPVNHDVQGVVHDAVQDETTTDLRPMTFPRYTANLPDLKEESHEDSSLNTSASNLKHSNFRFPGAGPPDLRNGGMAVDDAAVCGRASSVKSYRKSVLAKSRRLPSMEFSEMNLLEKLGDYVVEHRGSRSVELPPEMREEFVQLEQSRPASAGGACETYPSSFIGVDTSNATSSILADNSRKKRSFSPQALKEEVDNLNIPSVDGLTQRVSELMPSLRENFGEEGASEGVQEFAEEEKIMEHALEEIQEVSKPSAKQSVARLRPIAGSLSLAVTYDDLYKEPHQKNRDGASASAKELSEIGATKGRSWSVAHTAARDGPTVAELEVPAPPVLRARSLSLGHPELRVSLDSRLSSRSGRTLDSTRPNTVTDTRPWNREENYPWATTGSVDIDISLPRPAAARSSPRPGPSNLRHRLSEASSTSGSFGPAGTSASATSPVGSTPAPGSAYLPSRVRRESVKRWSTFAHKQPVNSPVGFDASGFATGPVRVREDDQSHGAGERYPTSALALPAYLHVADSTSRLSDYTTDEDAEPSSSRKAWLNRKSRRNRRDTSSRPKSSRAQEVPQPLDTNDTNLSEDDSAAIQPRANRRTFQGAEGMSKWIYQLRRFKYKAKTIFDRFLRLGRRDKGKAPVNAQPAPTSSQQ